MVDFNSVKKIYQYSGANRVKTTIINLNLIKFKVLSFGMKESVINFNCTILVCTKTTGN